jgi:outer membrane lipoprotein-sorting protein
MNRRLFPNLTPKQFAITLFFLISLTTLPAFAQETEKPATVPATDEKAEQIIKSAIEALGGSAYLNVRSIIGRGLFTQYKDGQSGIPSTFIDYIVYPDRERTEFKGHDGKIIQTNTGDTGWLYDGAAKTIKDMTKAQVEDFKRSLRSTIDYLLRGEWRKEGAKLSYAGRREAGLARRNEVLRLAYTDGYTVEFEFGAKDFLPMKILYKRKNADGEETAEEDRLAQHLKIAGITAPFVVDHYSTSVQTSRINYQSIEFNPAIADTLFARPANAKAVK